MRSNAATRNRRSDSQPPMVVNTSLCSCAEVGQKKITAPVRYPNGTCRVTNGHQGGCYAGNANARSSPTAGGGRAGAGIGVSVGRPRCRRMRWTTGGSSTVATKRSRAPQAHARTSIIQIDATSPPLHGRDRAGLAAWERACALSFRWAFLDALLVPSGSMLPSLLIGDRMFVAKFAYGVRVPFITAWLARWRYRPAARWSCCAIPWTRKGSW